MHVAALEVYAPLLQTHFRSRGLRQPTAAAAGIEQSRIHCGISFGLRVSWSQGERTYLTFTAEAMTAKTAATTVKRIVGL